MNRRTEKRKKQINVIEKRKRDQKEGGNGICEGGRERVKRRRNDREYRKEREEEE